MAGVFAADFITSRILPILALLGLLGAGPSGCDGTDHEYRCRLLVRSLVACPESQVDSETAKVVAYGLYALPDIEQEFHVSPKRGRLRLLDALRRIKVAESLVFFRHVARWDEDPAVRKLAAQSIDDLATAKKTK